MVSRAVVAALGCVLTAAGHTQSLENHKSPSRIAAVVDALRDILRATEQQHEEDAKAFKCYQQWCSSEVQRQEVEIEEGKEQQEELHAVVNSEVAAESRYEYDLASSEKDIEEITDAVQTAQALRDKDEAKFSREAELGTQSVQQIDEAIKIVQRQAQFDSFIQLGLAKSSAPGESSMALGVMQGLKTNMARNLEDAKEDEIEKVELHEELTSSKNLQRKEIEADIRKKGMLLADAKNTLAEARSDTDQLVKDLAENTKSLSATKKACDEKAREWGTRSEDLTKEKAALAEAIEFLSKAVSQGNETAHVAASFIQVSLQKKVVVFLQKQEHQLSGLASHGSAISREHFSGVKTIVKELINVTLEEQEAAETKFKSCTRKQKRNEQELGAAQEEQEQLAAFIDEKSALLEKLNTEAEDLEDLMKEADESQATAEKMRTKDHAAFEKQQRDDDMALKVLRHAKKALHDFYSSQDQTRLLQASVDNPDQPKTWSKSSRKTGETNVVLVMIDQIIDELRIEIQEAVVEEEEAQRAFQEYQVEAAVEKKDRRALLTEKVTRRAKVKVQLSSAEEDAETNAEDLTSIEGQIHSWNSTCAEHIENHRADSKERQFQLDQLRDVGDILDGADVAARTALLAVRRVMRLVMH